MTIQATITMNDESVITKEFKSWSNLTVWEFFNHDNITAIQAKTISTATDEEEAQ